jgi:hypothetical protein
LESNLLNLREDLLTWNYKHSEYKNIIINDSKKIYISSPIFRDHISTSYAS